MEIGFRRTVRLSVGPERRAAFIEFFEGRWRDACLADGILSAELWQSADDAEEFVESYGYETEEHFRKVDGNAHRTAAMRVDYEALLGESLDTAVVELFDVR